MSMFITNQDARNSFVVLESYTAKMDMQAKIESKLIDAMTNIHAVKDLTATKRSLVVLKAKLEAGIPLGD